ncbi:MAG: GntR family transcriptional regulator [Acidimicrobiales bacterium]
MSQPRYSTIADSLRERIAAGELTGARLLPSEAELSGAYAASRVTVRRALDVLRDEGLVASRQGYGWFVAADPLRQTLARLGTIEAQLAESGRVSQRRVLEFGFVAAPAAVRHELATRRVLEVRRLNLADGHPFALVTVWCPERLGKGISFADAERAPFYELLDLELGGATQTIAADAAEPQEAKLLEVPARAPVLVCRRTTRDSTGEPVLHSRHVFPAHRTEFVVELATADRSIAPSGLRLVGA